MPRSTKSRGVQGRKATDPPVVVDEVQDEQVEAALDAAIADQDADDLEEVTDAEAEQANDVAARPDAIDESVTEVPYAAQFDWDTATWTPRKGNGVRPCTCNRFADPQLACELTTKSRFATGHDARFKGILQRAWRKGEKLEVDFEPDDNASVTDTDGNRVTLDGRVEMEADAIAKVLAPKLVRWVTHTTRNDRLRTADAAAGTTVPQTAVEHTPDEELTDADVEAMEDDAPEFVEA